MPRRFLRETGIKTILPGHEAELEDQEATEALEKVILKSWRPVIPVAGGTYDAPAPWQELGKTKPREAIERALSSVLRVWVSGHPNVGCAGTAFIVGDHLALTTRHVAALFIEGEGVDGLRLRPNIKPRFEDDELDEDGARPTWSVAEAICVHPWWDIALLRLETSSEPPPPLTLLSSPLEDVQGAEVVKVGYSQRDARQDQELQQKVFGPANSVLGIAPGKLMGLRDVVSHGNLVEALCDDTTTLGNWAGSPLIDVETGCVVGIHSAGRYMQYNYAVPAWALALDSRLREFGIQFDGVLPKPTTVTWEEAWLRVEEAAGEEPPMAEPEDPPQADEDDEAAPQAAAAAPPPPRTSSAPTGADLARALDEGDDAKALVIVNDWERQLTATKDRLGVDQATEYLNPLEDHGRWSLVLRLGRAIMNNGQRAPVVRRLVARGYIEEGRPTEAIGELRALESKLLDEREPWKKREAQSELVQVVALLGDAYRRLYLSAAPTALEPREHDRVTAEDLYCEAYATGQFVKLEYGARWLGLRVHAVGVRGGFSRTDFPPELIESADQMLTAVEKQANERGWSGKNLSVKLRALLTKGRNDEARRTMLELVESTDLDAGRCKELLGDLRGCWRLTTTDLPGRLLLPLLTARLAELGGRVDLEDTLRAAGTGLEAVFDENATYKPLQWLKVALERARCVVRIGRSAALSAATGTGFVIDGEWLGDKWRGKPLVLTNAHVVTADAKVRKEYSRMDVLQPEEASVAFFETTRAGGLEPFESRVVRQLWSSPPTQYDATLLEIMQLPSGLQPPALGKPEEVNSGDRVNIIGHPIERSKLTGERLNADLSVSLYDNLVRKTSGEKLFYRTPTRPGSSGSPVFDNDWKLVGLHHAGPKWSGSGLNEGIRIDTILASIKKALVS